MEVNTKQVWQKLKYPYWFLTGWGLFWVLTFILMMTGHHKAWGVPQPSEKALTFKSLPPFEGLAQMETSPEVTQQLYQMFPEKTAKNYIGQINQAISRLTQQWQPGGDPASFLRLGDFQDSLALQQLSLGSIEGLSGQSLSDVPLSQFSLLGNQKLGQLIKIVPGLKDQSVSSVPFVQDAIQSGGYNPSKISNLPIGEVLQAYPQLGKIGLNQMNLDQYSLSAIPGIEQVPLGKFAGWQNASIASVPGLVSVPINQLGKNTGGIIGQIHWVLSEVEKPALNSISGSYQSGFSVPCTNNCAHIELGTNPLAAGKQWISGQYQKVPGGEGVLKAMFGGKEPTGRHPFGKGFKVVVWKIDESTGTVKTAWFFRICIKNLGCSPYGIGPVPGFVYQEGDWIFLGA
ncbi:hypothetical protein C7H19_19950 [Aphanothece hegewaldii CCALA 016]|uniref:Uncharacterized protein n=1 Tax=Aphanothece hegewaldii CCALA 016 TaxID=2107694 RepID=A0A2T1LT39_9CHRO|nr:hypothetical protein [Aphanothece hegewaldii]PSF33446.1 hypothetical protein C7H19_19950 [Aphanothece hegewaldii CCALA 016]